MVVRPGEERGDELGKVRADDVDGEGVDGDLDEAEDALDDLAVVGAHEDDVGLEELVEHGWR